MWATINIIYKEEPNLFGSSWPLTIGQNLPCPTFACTRSKFSALFSRYFREDNLLTESSFKSSNLRKSHDYYDTLYN